MLGGEGFEVGDCCDRQECKPPGGKGKDNGVRGGTCGDREDGVCWERGREMGCPSGFP